MIFEQYKILDDVSGLTVAVKPNLVCKKTPKCAATTHPSVVWAVCKLLKEAGADVVIAESPSGFYEAGLLKSLYKITGMEQAALESGARLNFDTTVTEVENPNGKYLKKLKILTPLAKADKIINVAKLLPEYDFWILGVAYSKNEQMIKDSNLKNITNIRVWQYSRIIR